MGIENSNKQEEPIVNVNKWDCSAVKNAVDDAVKKCIEDRYQYTERTRLVDGRLVISFLAVSCAAFALIYDYYYTFPVSKPVLSACVIAYFVLLTILQIYAWNVEGLIFYMAEDEDPTGRQPTRIWTFTSKMQRFEHMYTLEVELTEGGDPCSQGSLETSVTEWINEDGDVVSEVVNRDVLKLHDSLMPSKKRN